MERGPVQHYIPYFVTETYKGFSHRHSRKDRLSNYVHFHSLYHTLIDLQSNQVKRTPQEAINKFIIQKLNPLLVVDFRLISAFLYV